MKNLPTLRNDSSLAVQFSISVSKTRAILLFKIKIKLIEMLELNERMPGMWSAEYQATIPLSFFIIIYNYANDHQPIKITTRFSVSEWRHWTALTVGRFGRCWEEETTRSNRMNFRLLELCESIYSCAGSISLQSALKKVLKDTAFLSFYWLKRGEMTLTLPAVSTKCFTVVRSCRKLGSISAVSDLWSSHTHPRGMSVGSFSRTAAGNRA